MFATVHDDDARPYRHACTVQWDHQHLTAC